MTEEERKGALEWIKELNWSHIKLEAQDLKFNMGCYKEYIIEALEEYRKPRTVPREWVEQLSHAMYFNANPSQMLVEYFKEQGIEVKEGK